MLFISQAKKGTPSPRRPVALQITQVFTCRCSSVVGALHLHFLNLIQYIHHRGISDGQVCVGGLKFSFSLSKHRRHWLLFPVGHQSSQLEQDSRESPLFANVPFAAIARDGFTFELGQFYAQGRVKRMDSSHLKDLFLPRLTPEANKLLRDLPGFVSGQLQHYGVDYDEKELSGNGTLLLKNMLRAGKARRLSALSFTQGFR